jgi:ribosomal protein L7/L12
MSSSQLIVLAALFVIAVTLAVVVSRSGRQRRSNEVSGFGDSPFAELMSKTGKPDATATPMPTAAPLSQRSPIQTEWEPDNASPVHALGSPADEVAAPNGSASPYGSSNAQPLAARVEQVTRAGTSETTIPRDLEQQIRTALDANRKVSAINLLRDASGCGLAQAKDIVEALAAGDPGAMHALIGAPQANSPTTPNAVQRAVSMNPGRLRAQLATLLGQGEKVRAVKLLRDHSGWGLARCKEAVDALQAGNPALVLALEAQGRVSPAVSASSAATATSLPAAPGASGIDEPLLGQLRQLLAARRKIDAIKLLRERTGWGLKQSKEYVDSMPSA